MTSLQQYEYCDALNTMLLAHFLGTDSNVAVARACRRIRKRMKDKTIRNLLTHIADAKSPFNELKIRVDEIDATIPITDFISIGYIQFLEKKL